MKLYVNKLIFMQIYIYLYLYIFYLNHTDWYSRKHIQYNSLKIDNKMYDDSQ